MTEPFLIPLIATACLMVFKAVHYRRYFAGKHLSRWFYFGHREVMLSSSDACKHAKLIQNVLSILIIAGLMLSLLFFRFIH
jgi:hypothetical protein